MDFIYKVKRKLFNINNVRRYKSITKKQNYIMHATGGQENLRYLNCLESLERYYNKGYRLFEIDVRFSKDKELLLVHGGWQKMLNLDETVELTSELFLNSKLYGKYTTMSFKDLVSFMKTHTDMYVMLDIGQRDYDKTIKYYKRIVSDAEADYTVLQRIIAGSFSASNIEAIKSVYKFRIMNVFCPGVEERDELINTTEKLVNFCKENNIQSISMSYNNYNDEVVRACIKNKIIVYVFTINDIEEANREIEKGAIVGTDFLA